MDEHQQRRLADGLRHGSADAWHALYDAFAEPVWRTVARLLGGTSADVADVVQEIFLAAARSAAGFDPERGSLQVWLGGIIRRQVALHYRKRAQQDRLQRNALPAASPATPADPLETAELAQRVRGVLLALPADYEAVLTARYLEDTSVDDIARQERTTVVAIRSRLARARQAFRQAFAPLLPGFMEKQAGGHESHQ